MRGGNWGELMSGWIKLHRELIDKAMWKCSTPEQKVILITLLTMASHKENEWEWNNEKYTIQPGQFITSLKSIVEKSGLGISIQNVRTALVKFEKYEFLTSKSTNKNRLITITNWGLYQSQNDELTSNSTSNQQATNKQLTTIKNVDNVKNDKEDICTPIIEYLNSKTGKDFKSKTKQTQSLINARSKEGFTVDDFKKVIDIKTEQWLNKLDREGKPLGTYLRPATLFGTKFEGYFNEVESIGNINNPNYKDDWRGSSRRL